MLYTQTTGQPIVIPADSRAPLRFTECDQGFCIDPENRTGRAFRVFPKLYLSGFNRTCLCIVVGTNGSPPIEFEHTCVSRTSTFARSSLGRALFCSLTAQVTVTDNRGRPGFPRRPIAESPIAESPNQGAVRIQAATILQYPLV